MYRAMLQAQRSMRRGFTMAEAMVALSLIAIAGTALLLDTGELMSTTDLQMRQMTANGLAQQMMDEISGMRYMETNTSPTAAYLGPEGGETAGPGRSLFDDIDDYNGFTMQPPADRWGITLGTDDGDGTVRPTTLQMASGYLAQFRVQVTVYYVQSTALNTPLPYGLTTNYRGVQVQVSYNDPQAGWQQLATLTRAFSYVPSN